MKKVVLLLFLLFLVVPSVLALDLQVEKLSTNEVLVLGLNQPATFDLNVTNLGSSENVTFYNFFRQQISPNTPVYLEGKKSQEVSLQIYPPQKIKPGYYLLTII